MVADLLMASYLSHVTKPKEVTPPPPPSEWEGGRGRVMQIEGKYHGIKPKCIKATKKEQGALHSITCINLG